MNPAVTVGIVTTRTIGFIKAFVYVVAQVLGSVTAAAILWALTPTSFRHSFCVTRRNPGIVFSSHIDTQFDVFVQSDCCF